MNWNMLLFEIFPFVAVAVAVIGTVVRWRARPFSVSSLSTQLLESRRLFWGSVPFHWGITLILLGHLAALIVPRAFELWNGVTIQLYLLEITGLALALWTLVGLVVLAVRRLGQPRIRAVTTPMDLIVLAVLIAQVALGVWVATGYRFGSAWGTAVFVPYVRSLLRLQPRPELVAGLPVVVQAHAFMFFTLLVLFPFTRLVHIVTVPLAYLTRPWQIVIGMRRTPAASRSDRQAWSASAKR